MPIKLTKDNLHNIIVYDVKNAYNEIISTGNKVLVFVGDIDDCKYGYYDLIIFGDVIEHMDVPKAQRVLAYARQRCENMIIAVPFMYKQDMVRGNKWERHIQDELTPELFDELYPGYEVLYQSGNKYAYYIKRKDG